MKTNRKATVKRRTNETSISVSLGLDGAGVAEVETPVGFFSHMLEIFCAHGCFDLRVEAAGDVEVDQHHLVEDTGIALGQAFSEALGERRGIKRAGFFIFPMDEALAVAAVDLGGRPYLQYEASFERQYCGGMDMSLVEDFLQGFCNHAGANVSLSIPRGRSDHHKCEAAFKALARALDDACGLDERRLGVIPSTKGVI